MIWISKRSKMSQVDQSLADHPNQLKYVSTVWWSANDYPIRFRCLSWDNTAGVPRGPSAGGMDQQLSVAGVVPWLPWNSSLGVLSKYWRYPQVGKYLPILGNTSENAISGNLELCRLGTCFSCQTSWVMWWVCRCIPNEPEKCTCFAILSPCVLVKFLICQVKPSSGQVISQCCRFYSHRFVDYINIPTFAGEPPHSSSAFFLLKNHLLLVKSSCSFVACLHDIVTWPRPPTSPQQHSTEHPSSVRLRRCLIDTRGLRRSSGFVIRKIEKYNPEPGTCWVRIFENQELGTQEFVTILQKPHGFDHPMLNHDDLRRVCIKLTGNIR